MSGTRTKRLVRAIVNGVPVMAELESFAPPSVEKETEDDQGGRFVAEQVEVGLTVGDWSLSLTTSSADLTAAMGQGADVVVTVMESVKTADGNEIPRNHTMSGHVTKAEESEVKPGKESMTLTGKPFAYELKENGAVVHDINARTQKCVVGGKDLLSVARANVGL